MHVLITGANGFIAKALVDRLVKHGLPMPLGAIDRLTLMDVAFNEQSPFSGVRYLVGSIDDPAVVKQAFDTKVDVVFHLASIPAGTAERDYDLSRQVNVNATQMLLDASRTQDNRPVFVFSSTIAVLGGTFGDKVDDSTPTHPELTYGYQKVIGELLVTDYTRRGWIDGRSVRLAGIVARPSARTGQLSAFMSDIIREPAQGRPFVCPVSPTATCWLMSVPCIVDNLIHAAMVPAAQCGLERTWTLPAQRVSMEQLVDAVAKSFNVDAHALVTYQPQPSLEANFGRYPPLFSPTAERLGFRHDGDLPTLVKRALSLDA